MSGVPYTFATATTSIPLSQLDANFATPVTIGNTTVGLGNTVTVIGNLTLTNPTITSPTFSSQLPVSAMPTGSVVQAVSSNLLGNVNTTSTSYVNIFSVSITPQLSTSKILLMSSVPIYVNSSAVAAFVTIFRGSTDLSQNNGGSSPYRGFYQISGLANWVGTHSIIYLDSPASTSSLTYYFSARCNTGVSGIQVGNDGTSPSVSGILTAMEIR